MSYETLKLERVDRVTVITIDRPDKRNALNTQVRQELMAALEHLVLDEETRVIVFTGAGDRAFVAGADVAEFARRTADEQRRAMESAGVFDAIAGCPKPTIAMVNGYALGGGCELAIACDLRIASRNARFGQPEVNLGLIPGGGGTQRLPRLVGLGRATRLVLTGDLIDAEEALRIGLVERMCEPDRLRAETLELASSIAERSPVAVRLAKAALRAAQESPLSVGLARERELFLTAFSSEDKIEGISAFLAKRSPRFTGR